MDMKAEKKQAAKTGRPSTYSRRTAWRYCELIESGMSDAAAADELAIPRGTLHRWAQSHEDFSARLDEARRVRVMALEGVAFECIEESARLAADAGSTSKQVQAVRNKFDMCLKLLQVYNPRFKERQAVEVSGPDGKDLLPRHTQEEIAEFAAMMAKVNAEVDACPDGLEDSFMSRAE